MKERKYRFDIEQNTEEWDDIKVGKFSASSSDSLLMPKTNTGYISLIDKIIEERITWRKSESKAWSGNKFTERGHELEPIARDDYELRTFKNVKLIGVIELDDWILCSPDSLIDDDGLQQIKCPIFNTQRKYLKIIEKYKDDMNDNELLMKISSKYYKQMQFELFVSDRSYNVFTSFHPCLKAIDLKLKRDEILINEIKQRLKEAKEEVKKEIAILTNYSL